MRDTKDTEHSISADQTQPGGTKFATECASHWAALRAARRAALRTILRAARRQATYLDWADQRMGQYAVPWAALRAARRVPRWAVLRRSSIPSALSPSVSNLAKWSYSLALCSVSGRSDRPNFATKSWQWISLHPSSLPGILCNPWNRDICQCSAASTIITILAFSPPKTTISKWRVSNITRILVIVVRSLSRSPRAFAEIT